MSHTLGCGLPSLAVKPALHCSLLKAANPEKNLNMGPEINIIDGKTLQAGTLLWRSMHIKSETHNYI
jgi:hypothetical protein